MPVIKVKHVVSFSSEDKVHKAENLLKPETYRKWKCSAPGEKEASVVLQFEKAEEIHQIDIGNDGSAFVEVLVKRSSDRSPDYQVLMGASSFMTPLESRNENHCNRVRMFDPDKLNENVCFEKWDLVKIVCTQPFNKNIQYGLTFITFHSPPEIFANNDPVSAPAKNLSKLGAFRLKADEDEDEDHLTGSWFAKRKEKQEPDPVSGPAAIREASSLAANVLALTPKMSPSVRPQSKPIQNQTSASGSSSSSILTKDKKVTPKRDQESSFESKKRAQTSFNKNASREPVAKKAKTEEKKQKPFNRLMDKVVFVLSGFQNPLRSELRDKALAMGAKYKADWDQSCTHLVCAFLNTPKYIQVNDQDGKIVRKDWIINCYSRRELLPWTKYELGNFGPDTSTTSESESEEEEYISTKKKRPTKKNNNESDYKASTSQNKTNSTSTTPTVKKSPIKASPKKMKEDTASKMNIADNSDTDHKEDKKEDRTSDEEYEAPTDVDSEDTEDELRKVYEQNALENGTPEKPNTSGIPLPELPSFFKGKNFFFYGNFSSKERHTLTRYIIAYNGTLEEYMNQDVRFVVTNSKWDDNFDEALNENDNLIFVRPQWILKCYELEKLVPFQPFVVST